jgi:hypothetical protein
MPDMSFRIGDVQPLPYAAVPTLRAPLEIRNEAGSNAVQSISLNCQVQIEPLGRPYTAAEEARLLDLFGERERWARTMKPMHWLNTVVKVPAFDSQTSVDLLLPCTLDFDVAATKYFYGLDAGEISGVVFFSGTIFHAGLDGRTYIAQISWDREAHFRIPVEAWKNAIDAHYAGTAWLRLPKEMLQRLYLYKVARGIPTWEKALEQLLDHAEREELRRPLTMVLGGRR